MSEMSESSCEPLAKRQKVEPKDETQGDRKCKREEDVTVMEDKASVNMYNNLVELQRLREFSVLDEVRSDDEDSPGDDGDDSDDGKSEGVPEDEIEKMLEEDLPEDFKGAPKPKEKPYITRQKIVLEEKGVNYFESLPLDWMMVRHYSGMPIYIHKTSRVCTLSKPYFLGKGNTRRHDIPISAIPCLAYRKALEEEEKQRVIDREIEEQIRNGTWQKKLDTNKTEHPKKDASKPHVDKLKIPDKEKPNDDHLFKKPRCPYSPIAQKETNSSQKDKIATKSSDNSEINNDNLSEDLANCSNDRDEINCRSNNEVVTDASVDDGSVGNAEVREVNSEVDEVTSTTEENKVVEQEEIPLNRQPVVLPGGIVMPPPRVETVSTSWKTQHLNPDQVNGYCKSLFKFKTVNIMHFQRWADRRKYTKARKALQYPTLPEGTKLITIPAQHAEPNDHGGKANKRDWAMNMNGRSYLSVFHEYVRRALQKQPVYEFKQLENASSPYQATVFIGGMQYGVGRGSSKRAAKSAAARASIHILIPEMRNELDHPAAPGDGTEPDFTFFEYVGIEDPRITEFCAATCEPSPHAILRTCLLRNFGAGDRHIHTETKKLEYQKIELTMTVGKHTATVVCKNKKTAKQRASQAILQALHPHVRSWGSLLRLYGSRSVKSCKEKKIEEQQITLLQDAARHNEPNYAVLDKLRQEMRKLRERDEAVVPIGTLLVRDDLPTHSGSNLNNVDL